MLHLNRVAWRCVGAVLVSVLVAGAAQARLEYPVERTAEHLHRIIDNPYVSPVPSAALYEADERTPATLRAFTIGRTPGTAGGGYTFGSDEREVPAQDIYGFRIARSGEPDPDKPKVVLLSGQHPNESHSLYALEATINFLISDAPEAVRARELAVFYVYPQANPEGRWAGVGRSNPENPDQDNNRVWDDPQGWTNVQIVRDALFHDTDAQNIVYLLDYHSPGHRSDSVFNYTLHADAVSYWGTFAQNAGIRHRHSSGDPGMLRIWAMNDVEDGGLGVQHGLTPEIGRSGDDTPADYFRWGRAMGRTLSRALQAEVHGAQSSSGLDLLFDFNPGRGVDEPGWNVVGPVGRGYAMPLVDRSGQLVDVTLTIPEGLSRSDEPGWNHEHPLPAWGHAAALDTYLYFQDPVTFIVQGLDPQQRYDVHLVISRDIDRSSTITIDGQSQTWHDRDDGWSPAGVLVFEGVAADDDGGLHIAMENADTSGAINAMRLRQHDD